MGQFIYGYSRHALRIDDRTLAHLRIVVKEKLHRGESFMYDGASAGSPEHLSFWIDAAVPLQFHFAGSRPPRLNQEWLKTMLKSASGAGGLTIGAEPAEPLNREGAVGTAPDIALDNH